MTWAVCCYFCSWLIAVVLSITEEGFHTQWIPYCCCSINNQTKGKVKLPDSSSNSNWTSEHRRKIKKFFLSRLLCMTDVICNFCNRARDHLVAARTWVATVKEVIILFSAASFAKYPFCLLLSFSSTYMLERLISLIHKKKNENEKSNFWSGLIARSCIYMKSAFSNSWGREREFTCDAYKNLVLSNFLPHSTTTIRYGIFWQFFYCNNWMMNAFCRCFFCVDNGRCLPFVSKTCYYLYLSKTRKEV